MQAAPDLEEGSWRVAILICKAGSGQIEGIQVGPTVLELPLGSGGRLASRSDIDTVLRCVSSEAGKQKRKEGGPSEQREQLVQRLRRKQADEVECA